MKIIVTGSLGHIGKPLTEELVKKGHEVVVISSNPDRKKDIEALGAVAAIGSVDDVDFLTATFTGADVVHAMIPPHNAAPDPVAYSRKVADSYIMALRQSGVKRVVYISSYGAHLEKGVGLIKLHHYIENELLKLDLEALTFVRATYIYYNLHRFAGMIKSAGVMVANYGGDDRVVLVSPEDIAATALSEIEAKTTGNKIVYAASDERTCNEIAQILGEAIGKPDLKWVTISDDEMQKAYESYGMAPHVAATMVEMFAACHTGLINEDYYLHKPVLGNVKTEDFAKEFAAAFNAK
ncbi:NAD-dependent epimerase/dehydratase family protein [Mucilaginibacter corticis]|uniref:NAD-dependent epimerase/dehydratase family protein n=1 Tax=Mucilaginibacter corticis TaxID=2597670 RepID=A0A556MW01_9SPHI|nr:NAD(P)H-binding protein [Mucilaginibacter corticis]TSJ43988.1 NAD-dependent epimerase/dehydratase family protein [Mucilaginibacter corticis]